MTSRCFVSLHGVNELVVDAVGLAKGLHLLRVTYRSQQRTQQTVKAD